MGHILAHFGSLCEAGLLSQVPRRGLGSVLTSLGKRYARGSLGKHLRLPPACAVQAQGTWLTLAFSKERAPILWPHLVSFTPRDSWPWQGDSRESKRWLQGVG